MTELGRLALALAVGAAVGWGYFYGLWVTVQRLPRLRYAPAWLLLSLLLRLALLLAALAWVGREDWRRWAVALAGVIAVRLLLSRRIAGARDAADAGADGGASP